MQHLFLLGHAQLEHQDSTQAWSHYFETDRNILIVGLCLWLAFFLLATYVIKRKNQKTVFSIAFALLNIIAALMLNGENILSALVFLNLGFVFLFHNLFKNKICLVKAFKIKGKNG